MQILDNDAFEGRATGKNSAGSNYDVHPPSSDATNAAGEWNSFHLIVDGPSVTHILNGVTVVEYELWNDAWKEAVAGSKWANYADYGMRGAGHIAMQGDHSAIAFRNLKLKALPNSEMPSFD